MRFTAFSIEFEAPFLVVACMSAVLILDTSGKVAMCFLCAVIHEIGHLVAMWALSVRISAVRLSFFDVAIVCRTIPGTKQDFMITVFGPLFNLLSACLFYFVSHPLFVADVMIGLFNLLPVETFDGGHALALLLSGHLSATTVRVVTKILTFIFLVPIFVLSLLVLFYSKYNYSLLMISLYLIAVLFVK